MTGYTIAKYDKTEGCAGDLTYYIFKGQPKFLQSSAGCVLMEASYHVESLPKAHQVIQMDVEVMEYKGWKPSRTVLADADYYSPDLHSIVHCANQFAE